MAEPNTTGGIALYLVVGALFASLEQGPAMGALFGSFFFLATPAPRQTVIQKLLLLLFSWGFGYSVGIGVSYFGSGGYERLAMVAALTGSAIGSGLFASWHSYQNGGPAPAWLTLILDRLPFLKKRGDQDG